MSDVESAQESIIRYFIEYKALHFNSIYTNLSRDYSHDAVRKAITRLKKNGFLSSVTEGNGRNRQIYYLNTQTLKSKKLGRYSIKEAQVIKFSILSSVIIGFQGVSKSFVGYELFDNECVDLIVSMKNSSDDDRLVKIGIKYINDIDSSKWKLSSLSSTLDLVLYTFNSRVLYHFINFERKNYDFKFLYNENFSGDFDDFVNSKILANGSETTVKHFFNISNE